MQELSNDLIEKLFSLQKEAVSWYRPISDEPTNEIVDFEIQYANQACEAFFQVPLNEIIGQRVKSSKYFPKPTAELVFSQCLSVWTTGETMQISFYNPVFDRHLHVQRSRFSNGILTVIRDNTEVVKATELAQFQAGKLKSILDASLNGIIAASAVRDTSGKIVDFEIRLINNAFTSITKLSEEQTIGKKYSEVFHPASIEEVRPIYIDVIEKGRPIQKEIHITSDGRDQWFVISVAKWGHDGLVQTFQEHTSVKKLQHELEETLLGLKQSNERLTEFTYVASHDLNEPLRKVSTFTRLLAGKLGENADAGVLDYMSRIVKTVERMQGMLDSLLVYSRASRQNNAGQQVNLNHIVKNVLSELDNQVKETSATIHVHNLPVITGDGTQLTQVFFNLIGNALKYHLPNKPPVIVIGRDEDFTDSKGKFFNVITIKDNGIGFDPAESKKIFQLFYRLHPRHEYEGSGIGLAIVQRSMENHNGHIEAIGIPGEGAEFRLLFPA